MSGNLVLYHSNCKDGFAAALAAWKAFGQQAQYIPLQYQQYALSNEDGQGFLYLSDLPLRVALHSELDVYILDFSLKYPELLALSKLVHRIILLDHHKTAQADLTSRSFPGNVYIQFDMDRSGCELAWNYFSEQIGAMPYWIRMIALRDLWRHVGTDNERTAEEVNIALETIPFEFMRWDALTFRELLEKGAALYDYFKLKIRQAADFCWVTTVNGLSCAVVNAPYYQASELGNLLSKTHNMACVFSITKDQEVLCSLRSLGETDVSAIAKIFGGGGHRNAAGCKFPYYSSFIAAFGAQHDPGPSVSPERSDG